MAYSTDAVFDAARHTEKVGRLNDAFHSAREDYAGEVVATFTERLRFVPATALAVDAMDHQHGNRTTRVPLSDALIDALDSDKSQAALFAVLEKSTCPHVAALRTALAQEWIRMHADDVAELRAGE